MFGTKSVKLDKDLVARVKRYSEIAGYSSVEEFVIHALEKEISQLEESDSEEDIKEKLKGFLAPTARELVDAKADQLGYRVAKSRKFVCPRPLKGALSQLCKDVGAPSIVRGV